MNRDALGPVVVAALAVLALSVGAATLDDIESASGVGAGGANDVGSGTSDRLDLGRSSPPKTESDPFDIPPFVYRLLAVLVLVAFLIEAYSWRDNPSRLVLLAVLAAGWLAVVYFVLLGQGSHRRSGKRGLLGNQNFTIPGGGALNSVETVTTDPALLAVLVAVALLVGVAVLRFGWNRKASESESNPDSSESDSATTAKLGRAAGRAADRIAADGEAENEVYRTWREMTDHLDVENPDASTPGEFARAATDAGMARRDVNELTDLFRTVRYGGSRVTDDRETRAVSALRRIEREYAGEP